MTRVLVGITMLVVGIAGFGVGRYFQVLRRECLAQIAAVPQPAAQTAEQREKSLEPPPAPADPAPPADLAHLAPVKEWNKAYARIRFCRWISRADLTPAKRLKIEAVLQSNAATVLNLNAHFIGDGRHRHRGELVNRLTDAMRPVLNADELAEFRQDLILEEVQRAINELGAELHRREIPLTPDQCKRLSALIAESRSPADQAAPVLELSATDWEVVMTKGASFLSLQQLKAVHALATQNGFMRIYRPISGYMHWHGLPGL